jgi:hypothetical protein
MSPQTLGLLAALAWPLVMIVGLFLVIRTPALKWRIPLAVICFVGVGAFWMRKSDGLWGFVPGAINILGPGASAGFYKATIPLGALISIAICLGVRAAIKRARAGS